MKSPVKIAINLFLVLLVYLGVTNHGVPQNVDAACGSGGGGSSGGGTGDDFGDDSGGGDGGGGGGGGDDGCFIAGTLIRMGDGTDKRIEDVGVGESILSYDEINSKFVTAKVNKVWSGFVDVLYNINNGMLITTHDHPIWTSNGWSCIDPSKDSLHSVKIKNTLSIGDVIMNCEGEFIKINSIERIDAPGTQVFNLCDVLDTHVYFASNILVHNK